LETQKRSFSCGILVFATIVIATLIVKNLERMLEKKSKDQNIDITRFAFLKKIIIVSTIFLVLVGLFLPCRFPRVLPSHYLLVPDLPH
jgi:hypothetical protein